MKFNFLLFVGFFFFAFSLGFLSSYLYGNLDSFMEIPFGLSSGNEKISPIASLTNEDILVYSDRVVLKISDATISNYAETGSMKPTFDKGAKGIRVKPSSEENIFIGDIVSFRKNGSLIVHRVIEKGEDEKGVYFVTKGDNNDYNDGKIRFSEIEYKTIALIY